MKGSFVGAMLLAALVVPGLADAQQRERKPGWQPVVVLDSDAPPAARAKRPRIARKRTIFLNRNGGLYFSGPSGSDDYG